jgi:hypothetical protein
LWLELGLWPDHLHNAYLGGGGTILDGVAQPGVIFAVFGVSFFDTSAFCFSLIAWKASVPGSGRGA